jgi:hypothetical protein
MQLSRLFPPEPTRRDLNVQIKLPLALSDDRREFRPHRALVSEPLLEECPDAGYVPVEVAERKEWGEKKGG